MTNNKEEHLELVLLLRRTTKIESMLEIIGGVGGGIWDKYKSIRSELPNNFKQKIIDIGSARNEAVHGSLKVKNIQIILKECDSVLEVLENKKKLDRLKKEINLKLKEFHFFDKDNKIVLKSSLNEWIQALNAYNFNSQYSKSDIDLLLSESNSKFNELNDYAKEYVIKKRLKQLPYIIGISVILIVGYLLFKEYV